jgi:hypothetical protein
MAKEILVGNTLTNEMIESGRAIVEGIDDSTLEVVGTFWLYFEEAEEWRLALISKRLNKDGPLALYRELSHLFYDEDKGTIFGPSLPSITFLDPSDKLVRALVSMPGGANLRNTRLPGFFSQGIYVPDSYVYFIGDDVKPLNGRR